MKWAPRRSSDQLQQQLPGCKWGHTCNAVRNLIYIFGGCGRDECQTNDVHVFDIGTYTWSKPVIKGTHPSPRDSHSSTAVGLSSIYQHFGDVPALREGHSASLIGDNLFVFGGCGKSSDPSEEYYNDLHVLNTNTFVWKSTTGVLPIPRDSHTCSSYKNCFVVMGGKDGGNAYLNDVHILDKETMAWREVKTTGAELMPRARHTTISHGKYLVVFGGFSDDRKLFNDVHTLDLRDSVNAEQGILFFYGGCNKELEALDDMYFLDTEMLREKDSSEPKLSMRKELKRRRQEYRATPFMLDKQRDADKSLVSSHGGTSDQAGLEQDVEYIREIWLENYVYGNKVFKVKVSILYQLHFFTTAATDRDSGIVHLVFETVEKVVRDTFNTLLKLRAQYSQTVNCLAFINNKFNDNISLNSLAFLHFCALKLGEGELDLTEDFQS
ncbi:hypothetical protein SELMODRAFT_431742 [Selaginella moellendorffii]|uniref:Uncharacterized protein n=1 Tax=Selaginella moellendorffii TaxID=88036 RepID=D8TDM6_SELML|nr:hypothetical protein SELMODRAFT_431742 [Selaginella moellendorffii]